MEDLKFAKLTKVPLLLCEEKELEDEALELRVARKNARRDRVFLEISAPAPQLRELVSLFQDKESDKTPIEGWLLLFYKKLNLQRVQSRCSKQIGENYYSRSKKAICLSFCGIDVKYPFSIDSYQLFKPRKKRTFLPINSSQQFMTLLSGPNIGGNEWKYVKECLDTAWVSSVGSYVTRFEQMLAEFTGTKYAVATSNGTAALHISLLLSGVKTGDYVIVPNLTFIASLNSIKYTGASPILMDVDEATWQMDLDLLEDFLKTKTTVENDVCILLSDKRAVKAIMPVHVLGNMCDMERLNKIASEYKLAVVEDATEALGSYYNGKHSGSFGQLGCFSFNGNKIITTGGGGMIVTDDEELAKKAKHITTQAKSDPFEYVHDEIGYNYRLVNVLAAIGVAQMEQLPGFIKRKKEIDRFYKDALKGVGDITFQQVAEEVDANYWLFTIRTTKQKELLKALNEKNLQSRPFWVPMAKLAMFADDLYINNNDKSGTLYDECLSIPCSSNITDAEMESVVSVIKTCF